jgi:hypothetical protein
MHDGIDERRVALERFWCGGVDAAAAVGRRRVRTAVAELARILEAARAQGGAKALERGFRELVTGQRCAPPRIQSCTSESLSEDSSSRPSGMRV